MRSFSSLAYRALGAASVSGVVIVAGACSVTIGSSDATVNRTEMEDSAADQLEQEAGEAPEEVICPEELTAEVGATTDCVIVWEDVVDDAVVTVTEVSGSDADFDVEIIDVAIAWARHRVEEMAAVELENMAGVPPQSVDCPDYLDTTVGAAVRCTLTALNGDQVGLTVTVTALDQGSVDDGTIDASFSIVVDDEPPD